MQLLKNRGILIFWIVLLLDCYFIYTSNFSYRIFTRPFLIPILAFYIYLNSRKNHHQHTKTLLFFALIASWISDMLLIRDSKVMVYAGMISLFAFYILFGTIFYRMNKLRLAKCQEAFLGLIVYFLLNFQLFRFISSELKGLKIPVIVFSCGVGFAVVMVVNLLNNPIRKVNAITYHLPAIMLLFVSLVVMCLQYFLFNDVAFLSIIAMLSYGYGMTLAGEGFSKYFKG